VGAGKPMSASALKNLQSVFLAGNGKHLANDRKLINEPENVAKVTRLALQNAAPVAGLLLASKATVVWMPDTEDPTSAMSDDMSAMA